MSGSIWPEAKKRLRLQKRRRESDAEEKKAVWDVHSGLGCICGTPELLEAVIEEESGGNPDAVGAAGEIGLMQVYPKYHRMRAGHLNVYDLSDPEGNILVGADYLAELFKEYGDIGTALMVYNGVLDAEERGKRGSYTDYAEKVMKRAAQLERLHKK